MKEMVYKISEQELNKIFGDYCENDSEMASEEVQSTCRKHDRALEEYVIAVIEDNFKKGFCYALKLVERGVIA